MKSSVFLQHKKDHESLPCQSCKTFPSKRNLNHHRKCIHKPEQQKSDKDSMNYVPAELVYHEESMNLSTCDLEGAVVISLDLDLRQTDDKTTLSLN